MVLFDLFNEPYLDLAGAGDAWGCWLSGCTVQGFQAAGMQAMLDAVRGTGAKQVVIASGLSYANKLDGWLAHKPSDPTGNLMAGFHLYNDGACGNAGCWNGTVAAVAQRSPSSRASWASATAGTASSTATWTGPTRTASATWAGRGTPSTAPASPRSSPTGAAPLELRLGLQTHLARVNRRPPPMDVAGAASRRSGHVEGC